MDEPKNSGELREQINEAIKSIKFYKHVADIEDAFASGGLSTNIDWLESLLKLANIELKR
ncbi:MAG: hypothetical protein PHE15_01905 [Dehalococcoidales bacterium]|nr:hypothetical protein [Dehalococcoidales bacterium]